MKRVVVATPDVVGRRMAGPGIRAFALARELSKEFDTTLIARHSYDFPSAHGIKTLHTRTAAARAALRDAGIVLSQPTREVIANVGNEPRLLFDLFDPVLLELDELYGQNPKPRQRIHRWMEARRLRFALRRGDGWIVAAPKQIDYYTALNTALDRDRFLVMPFGCDDLSSDTPRDDPPTIVWNGGVWEWLDPATAIEAVRLLNAEGTRCRLVFLGAKRPTGADAPAPALSPVKGDQEVVFDEEWVPYEERGRWLGRCKVAIMLHRRTAEAEFSVRTRVFDAIGAGLPVVATRGGYAAELVERHQTGCVVEPSDLPGVVDALRKLLTDDELHARSVLNSQELARTFRWERVVEPVAAQIRAWQGEE
jgi:glycosyltransferase involved in cell wall biosynthesis